MSCECCRNQDFPQSRTRQRFCPSCESIIEMETEEIESLLALASETRDPELRTKCIREAEEALTCSICLWDGKINRVVPDDLRLRSAYTQRWVIAGLKHRLRHVFPGRFPISRQFTPKWFKKTGPYPYCACSNPPFPLECSMGGNPTGFSSTKDLIRAALEARPTASVPAPRVGKPADPVHPAADAIARTDEA